MNATLSQSLIECLGWTLLHFVWQGFVIAALLAGGLRMLRQAAPNHRYLVGCFALLLLVVAPVITLNYLLRQYQSPTVTNPAPSVLSASAIAPATPTGPPIKFIFAVWPAAHKLDFVQRIEVFLPLIVIGWVAGVLILSFRLLAGWLQVKRLKCVAIAGLDEAWQRKLIELGRRLGIDRPVRLLQSALVEVPTVIGWLRPVILLPASCLVGLSPAQLESILAHELAHIRRHDYLVNLLQSVVETFLFYHPAVWWVSRKVREEREHCCDDIAVEVCGDRIAYARALATLEELRVAPAQLALAASGAPLLQRIRRLAGQSRGNAQRPAWPIVGIMLLLMLLGLAMFWRGNRAMAGDGTNEPTNAPIAQPQLQKTNFLQKQNTTSFASHEPIHSGPGREAIMSKLDHIMFDSIEYDYVPLGKVINDLARIAKSHDPDHIGINFFADRQVAASVKIKINRPLHNIRLADALDAIAMTADQPIRFSVLEYGVKFSFRDQHEPLETRTFQVNPNTFHQLLETVSGIPFTNDFAIVGGFGMTGQTNTFPASTKQVQGKVVNSSSLPISAAQIQLLLTSFGMDFGTNNPANADKMFVWIEEKGFLRVRSTKQDLDLIEKEIARLVTPSGTANMESNGLQASNVPLAIASKTAPKKQLNLKIKMIEIDATQNHQAGLEWLLKDNSTHFNRAENLKPFTGRATELTNALSTVSNSISLQAGSVLTRQQFTERLKALEQYAGMNELTLPEITTESGRRSQVMAADVMSIVTGLELSSDSNGKLKASYKTESLCFGPMADLLPELSDINGKINVIALASVSEFLGYNGPKGTAITVDSAPDPFHAVLPLPHFRVRRLSAEATVGDGETLVLGGEGVETTNIVKTKVPWLSGLPLLGRLFQTTTSVTKVRKNLLVFVTPTIINPDGTRYHTEDETPPPTNSIPSLK